MLFLFLGFRIVNDPHDLLMLFFLEAPRDGHETLGVPVASAMAGRAYARLRPDRRGPPGPPSLVKKGAAPAAERRPLQLAPLLVGVVLIFLHSAIPSSPLQCRGFLFRCHASVSFHVVYVFDECVRSRRSRSDSSAKFKYSNTSRSSTCVKST